MVVNRREVVWIDKDGSPRNLPEREVLLEAIIANYEGGHLGAANVALNQLVNHCRKLDPNQRNESVAKLSRIEQRALQKQSQEKGLKFVHKQDLDELVKNLGEAIKTIQNMPTLSPEVDGQRSTTWDRITHFLLSL